MNNNLNLNSLDLLSSPISAHACNYLISHQVLSAFPCFPTTGSSQSGTTKSPNHENNLVLHKSRVDMHPVIRIVARIIVTSGGRKRMRTNILLIAFVILNLLGVFKVTYTY